LGAKIIKKPAPKSRLLRFFVAVASFDKLRNIL